MAAKKKTRFSIVSANVEAYKEATPAQLAVALVSGGARKPKVVALQEDLVSANGSSRMTAAMRDLGYHHVGSCVTNERVVEADALLGNSLFRRADVAQSGATMRSALPRAEGVQVSRCAVGAVLGGVRVANAHLTGGRFDDPLALKSTENADIKARQARAVVGRLRPQVFVGDFNGEPKSASALAAWRKYPLFQNLKSGAQRAQFFRYMGSHHDALTAAGFDAVSDARKHGATTSYGVTPDHVYVLKSACSERVRRMPLRAEKLSDHDALEVRLCFKTRQQQPHR